MKPFLKHGILALVASAGIFAHADLAHADPHDRGRGDDHSNRSYHGHNDRRDDDRWRAPHYTYTEYSYRSPRRVIVINTNDRRILRDYVRTQPIRVAYYSYNAPHYLVGAPLPRGVLYYSVPHDVLMQLQPAPIGYRYVRVDNDILLMSLVTHEVVDAVTLL